MNYLNTKIHKNNVSSFYKNIFVMLRGTLVAQVIATIGALYLAKIYGEEAYGFFGVYNWINSSSFQKIVKKVPIGSTLYYC
jgi:hypothetical protein